MRVNSYVMILSVSAEPEIGIITQRITPHRFIVSVGENCFAVSRREIVRLKPRLRRNYRQSQR